MPESKPEYDPAAENLKEGIESLIQWLDEGRNRDLHGGVVREMLSQEIFLFAFYLTGEESGTKYETDYLKGAMGMDGASVAFGFLALMALIPKLADEQKDRLLQVMARRIHDKAQNDLGTEN